MKYLAILLIITCAIVVLTPQKSHASLANPEDYISPFVPGTDCKNQEQSGEGDGASPVEMVCTYSDNGDYTCAPLPNQVIEKTQIK